MSPYRFKRTITKIGRIILFLTIIAPQFYLVFQGVTISAELVRNKNNTVGSIGGGSSIGGYTTYIYSYKIDNDYRTIEASDFFINDFSNVKIVYNPNYPKHAAIKSVSGIFFMRALLFICSLFLFESLISLFLKE